MRVGFNRQLKRARFHRHSCVDDSEERSIGKLQLGYLRSSLFSGKPALRRRTIPSQPTLGLDDRGARVVHGPRRDRPGARLFSILTTSRPRRSITDRLTTDEARPHGSDPAPAAGVAASIAADKRGVTSPQPQIHDSLQLNSRSIGDGEAHSSRQRE